MKATVRVVGKTIDLSGGRRVFVGTSDQPDNYFLGFRNTEGEETRLVISREAKDALTALLMDVDTPAERWVQVIEDQTP